MGKTFRDWRQQERFERRRRPTDQAPKRFRNHQLEELLEDEQLDQWDELALEHELDGEL